MKTLTVHDWLNKLGGKTPAPGGGAVAGVNSALSAATLKMVCEYTSGSKYADVEAEMRSYNDKLGGLLSDSLVQAENDEKAYLKLREAYSLSKDVGSARQEAIQKALEDAVKPACKIIEIIDEIIEITKSIHSKSNPNLSSDIAVSAANAKSALESAIVNIEINLKQINNAELAESLKSSIAQAESLIGKADSTIAAVRHSIGDGG